MDGTVVGITVNDEDEEDSNVGTKVVAGKLV